MTDNPPPLDRAALFSTLTRHGVRFVLVGALAAQAHGATRATADADICPEWSPENLGRLATALTELGARLKIGEGSIETLELKIDARTIHSIEIGAWRTAAGDMDVLLGIPSASRRDLARYDQLVENALELRVDDLRILVASLADIIRSKEITDRPKDRAALTERRSLHHPKPASLRPSPARDSGVDGRPPQTSQDVLEMSGNVLETSLGKLHADGICLLRTGFSPPLSTARGADVPVVVRAPLTRGSLPADVCGRL